MANTEATLWSVHSTVAEEAFDNWNSFLNLQEGSNNNTPLSAAYKGHFMTIIRAVSWVESRHGDADENDPMQCGHPSDSWWKSLTNQSGNVDRFIGGPGKGNWWANQLPAAVATTTGFPNTVLLTQLSDKKLGHDDPDFTAEMSYYWGIPYLIQRINTHTNITDGKTYKCGTYSKNRLVQGAIAYNGGGDPQYGTKINAALNGGIGWTLP